MGSTSVNGTTSHALKEWAVAVDALLAGETIMLLRKGGIREEGKHFRVAHSEVLLYPTYEHQEPALLKAEYQGSVRSVPSGWHPESIRIGGWARITGIFQVSEAATVEALLPFHIWNERFAAERFGWKPRHPLYVLLLRAYRLREPRTIPYVPAYGGCRSWIDLLEHASLDGMVPAIPDAEYDAQAAAIRDVVTAVMVEE